MGKSYSVDKSFGDIAIQFESFKYVPGSQINGFIYLNLLKPFPSDVLDIFIAGREKSKFVIVRHHNYGNRSSRTVSVYKEKRDFFAYTYQIRSQINGQFPAGQYSYPFSFVLPYNLKSTFLHLWNEEGHNCYGKIEYVVKGLMKNKEIKKKMVDKGSIVVVQHSLALPQEIQVCNVENKVKAYCGVNKGTIKMTSRCDKKNYLIGEVANVNLEIDASKMKADIKKINCQLSQAINLRAQGYSKALFMPVLKIKLPGVKKGEQNIGQNAFITQLPILTNNPIQPEVTGDLVDCHYNIDHFCDVDRCQCRENEVVSSLRVNVQSCPPESHFIYPKSMSQNWNPQVLPPLICTPSAENMLNDAKRQQLGFENQKIL